MAIVIAPVPRRRAPAPGFTLVELMVALTIFAMILVGIVPMMISAIAHNRVARRTLEARAAMNSYSELMKTLPPDSFPIGTSSWAAAGNYRIQRVVTADTTDANFRLVTMTIRWNADTSFSYTRQTGISLRP